MYIFIQGQNQRYPYTLDQFRQEHPNISLAGTATEELLASLGLYYVEGTVYPNYDLHTQTVREEMPILVDGKYQQNFLVIDLTADTAALNIRQERDKKITESDWTQLTDSPVDKVAWAEYRQALRDIPSQQGFPFAVSWPVPPS